MDISSSFPGKIVPFPADITQTAFLIRKAVPLVYMTVLPIGEREEDLDKGRFPSGIEVSQCR